MFTGIIEALACVESVHSKGKNKVFSLHAPFAHELKVDQSVAHDGVCLTVIATHGHQYQVEAINETLQRSTLGNWLPGHMVNVERCLAVGGRLDGHIVQGHIDTTAICTDILEEEGSWRFYFEYKPAEGYVTVPKGSIAVNGVSLTVVDSLPNGFSVAIIPYTYYHTNFQYLKKGSLVNIEFDIIGKYIQRLMIAYAEKTGGR